LFSDITNIDWYDGPILAIAKMINSEDWHICSLVYIDFNNDERIFQIVKVQEAWAKKIIEELNKTSYKNIRARIKHKFLNYKSDLFIAKTRHSDDKSFELKKISNRHLKYYSSIDKIINQDKRLQNQWKRFFK
jgi:hypothetical protein